MFPFALTTLRLLKAIIRSWSIPTFRAGLALAVLLLLSGTLFYRSIEGWSWVDSLYFSATTMSTVGFGDLSPQTDAGKLFTVLYIFVGVGVFVALFAQFARALLHIEDNDKSDKTAGQNKEK
ncbi:potassium channel family protein [Roseobacter ponti]|uniref:Two pore domain potassium channel family protein n=1 Tax=Roseobacter ponti TaxID=1891787 RepID=A0A858SYN1_9RHOB|nr:potassium channel family protein [Roseobacter ponti]QJF51966.1 two pore domain potassium channel family protein [Roseobacter ponti]